MPSVLLCCVDEDESRVDLLALALEKAGIAVSVFVAGANQKKPVGATALQRSMSTSDVVVVCWSKQSVGTSWMKRSARQARRKGQYLSLQLDRVSLGWWVRSRFNGAVLGWPARSADKGVEALLEMIQRVIRAKTERVHRPLSGNKRLLAVVLAPFLLAAALYYGLFSFRATTSEVPAVVPETEDMSYLGTTSAGTEAPTDTDTADSPDPEQAAATGAEWQGRESLSDAGVLPGEVQKQDLAASVLGTLAARQLRAVILGEGQKLPRAERNARSALEIDPEEPSALLTLGLIELFVFQNRQQGRALLERFHGAGMEAESDPSRGSKQALLPDDRGFLQRSLQAFDQGIDGEQRARITLDLSGVPLANPRLSRLCNALAEHDQALARRLIRQLDATDRLQILAHPCLLQNLNQGVNRELKQAIVIPQEAPDNA